GNVCLRKGATRWHASDRLVARITQKCRTAERIEPNYIKLAAAVNRLLREVNVSDQCLGTSRCAALAGHSARGQMGWSRVDMRTAPGLRLGSLEEFGNRKGIVAKTIALRTPLIRQFNVHRSVTIQNALYVDKVVPSGAATKKMLERRATTVYPQD